VGIHGFHESRKLGYARNVNPLIGIDHGKGVDMNRLEIEPYHNNIAYFDDMHGEDYEDLKRSILDHGIIEPIVINQNNVIICGHQRYRACQDLRIEDIPVVVREVKDDDEHETLLIEENLRRRQLSTSSMARAIKRLYEIKGIDGKGGQPYHRDTVATIAEETGKSVPTVKRLRTIADLIPELSKMLDAKTITQKVAYQIAQMDAEGQVLVFDHLEAQAEGSTIQEAEAKDFKDKYKTQQELTKSLKDNIETLKNRLPTEDVIKKITDLESQLKAEKEKPAEQIEVIPEDYETVKSDLEKTKETLKKQKTRSKILTADYEALMKKFVMPEEIPQDKYNTIVIDPPWPVKKIHRDERPNQDALDYPTMTVEEIMDFPVSQFSADNSFLFMWTTQKYLPHGLRILKTWGFNYLLTMVWHKPGGFQPFSLPQYNCEFVLLGKRGLAEFKDTKAFPCCFEAPRGEHSEKPQEFYDLLDRVTGGDKIDVFARKHRNGWTLFGNEKDKLNG